MRRRARRRCGAIFDFGVHGFRRIQLLCLITCTCWKAGSLPNSGQCLSASRNWRGRSRRTSYLTGGAIRDLISGMPIRDLDFTVEGNPFKIVRELEKGGARAIYEDERLRHVEMIFAGDVDGSISAARDDFYDRPGAKPEIRWSTVMEDLRRRDFSVNAIAISLNPNSRGLLLDPTNGLADLERREVRALSIHAFTNQPVRLMRILRYAARMGFKMESRTSEWFELAVARNLHENLDGVQVGWEVHHLGREDNPVATLRLWETHNLLAGIHPQLAKRRPDYERLTKLAHVRESMLASGVRARLFAPVTHFLLGRLKAREAAAALRHLELRADESEEIAHLIPESEKAVKILKSPKMKAAERRVHVFVATASGLAGVHSGGISESQGAKPDSQLPAALAAFAAGSAGGRAGRFGHPARAEVRQNSGKSFRSAVARTRAAAAGPHQTAAAVGGHQG